MASRFACQVSKHHLLSLVDGSGYKFRHGRSGASPQITANKTLGDTSSIMADENAQQSTQQPAPVDESEKLLGRVLMVSKTIHTAIEGNQLSEDGRKDLDELSRVLDMIKDKLTPQAHPDGKKDGEELLPESKREELGMLLDGIDGALRQPKSPPTESEHDDVQKKKKMILSMAAKGCNPFKLRASSSQQKSRQQGGGGEGGQEEEVVSLKLLLRLARLVLEPEQYYEWTTSYVDESRIYGWDEKADEVMDALVVDSEDDRDFFRAAAITGIHGSGKTALAQKVFVHDKAKDNFPIRLWVCVGPPDSEDRFNLLYRMLDNLGHDTNRIEDFVVDTAEVVQKQREAQLSEKELDDLRKKAADMVTDKDKKTPDAVEDEEKLKFRELLKEKVDDNTPTIRDSKIGVLLYILHVTLAKTGYLIVFDDIRVYGEDGWYSNLTLPPPPPEKEWYERLAYGLPKTGKHRSAVLVTCRKEDDARTMVRTGRVFRPPELKTENGWKLFDREYKQAKEDYAKKNKDAGKKDDPGEDLLFKELEEMKEEIVNKCLGLPVAIIEAAKGFACSDLQPLPSPEEANKPSEDKTGTNKDMQTEEAKKAAADDNKPSDESAE